MLPITDPAPIVGSGKFRYRPRVGWEKLPEGWSFGEVAAVAVASGGDVTVFNRGEHPVIQFDSEGNFLRSWGEESFRRAHGLFIAPDDTAYFVDDLDHTVKQFTLDGRPLMKLGTSGVPSATGATSLDYRSIQTAGAPFHYPTDVAVGPNGDLYVSDGYGNARVHRFAPDGTLIRSWGEPGSGPSQFYVPHGIAVDGDGRVWVADRENCRLQIFDAAGEYLDEWGDLARPCELFIDAAGVVYVAELGFKAGMWPGTVAPSPDAPTGRVSIFSPDHRLLSRWGGGPDPMAADNFFAPHDIWVDAAGVIYVGEVTLSGGANYGLVPRDTPSFRTFAPIRE